MKFFLGFLASVALSVPAVAQDKLIKASDPEGIVALLDMAGYDPELSKDQFGDPEISFLLDGWGANIAFYGCDEEGHDECESLQFIGGFDTNGSFSPQQALELSASHRYSQITMDSEGDIWVRWDVVTGDGISPRLFLQNVQAYSSALSNAGATVFPDDDAAEAAADTGSAEDPSG